MGTDREDNAANQETPLRDRNFTINDPTFCIYIKRLKDLHNFLYEEAVPVNPSDTGPLEMGNLNALHYDIRGRAPSVQEWNQVERQTQTIFLLLTPALRRKFSMGGTPWVVAWMPVYFLGVAALSLFFAVVSINFNWPLFLILLDYLIWLATLGAVGALAFIGMNALSIQNDITFDLTNKRLIMLRVALGALFAVVLTLPFGYVEFLNFCNGITFPLKEKTSPETSVLTRQAVFLLLPFVLGFSTSLVILILNQIVEAVQTLFGRNPLAVAPPSLPPRVTVGNSISDATLPGVTPQDTKQTDSPPPPDSVISNAVTSSATKNT